MHKTTISVAVADGARSGEGSAAPPSYGVRAKRQPPLLPKGRRPRTDSRSPTSQPKSSDPLAEGDGDGAGDNAGARASAGATDAPSDPRRRSRCRRQTAPPHAPAALRPQGHRVSQGFARVAKTTSVPSALSTGANPRLKAAARVEGLDATVPMIHPVCWRPSSAHRREADAAQKVLKSSVGPQCIKGRTQ
jgi:hypothetical protein